MNNITKFDPLKLANEIGTCVNQGIFKGEIVTTKGDMFHILADVLGCDSDTVRKWCYPDSNGPKDPTWINALEKELGVSLRMDEDEVRLRKNTVKIPETNYTEYAKKCIHKGYILMKEHINSPEVTNEECLINFWNDFEKLKASIPTPIYKKMELFSRENFDSIVYNWENIFPDNKLESFLNTIIAIEYKLDKFTEEELNPLIVY